MKLWLKILLGSIGGIGLSVLLVLGYFGFIPVLSDIMGANTPRDLGVRYTEADLASANSKLGLNYTQLSAGAAPQDSLLLSGSKPVSLELTSEELTALTNSHDENWKYYPVSNCQTKINDDGTLEVSGVLNLDVGEEYAEATNMPEATREKLRTVLGLFQTNPRIYAKASPSIQNGNVDSELLELEIGRINAPTDLLNDNNHLIESFFEDRISNAGITVNSATLHNGKVDFDGTIPETIGFSSG